MGYTSKYTGEEIDGLLDLVTKGGIKQNPKNVSDVNFRDYDGTILYSYTKEDFLKLKELPALPEREGLICQEWNYSLEDAKAYVQEYGVLEVGATYITDDGKTRLYITVNDDNTTVELKGLAPTKESIIYWGDGNQGGFDLYTTLSHTYNKSGDYCIEIEVPEDAQLSFKCDSTKGIMGKPDSLDRTVANLLRLRKVLIGARVSFEGANYAFGGCKQLKSISIPSGVTSIPQYMFQECYGLDYVSIPKSIKTIGQYAFFRNYSLMALSICNGVTLSNTCFCQCYSLPFVLLPVPLTAIPSYMCDGNNATIQIIIPKNVSSIGEGAYSGNRGVTNVIFPESVISIGNNAFSAFYGIQKFDFSNHKQIPTLGGSSAFYSLGAGKIVVPDNLYDDWKKATNWSTYASNIVKASEFNG